MALKCRPKGVTALSELMLKNAGKRKGSDFHLGSKQRFPQGTHKVDLMKPNRMYMNMGYTLSVKKQDAQTSMIAGAEALQLS